MLIYTIGHSVHTAAAFTGLLQQHQIKFLADVRRFPGSRRLPWFSSEKLEKNMHEAGIQYRHFERLGGRRTAVPESQNTQWRNTSFRAYADYMDTPEFGNALDELKALAEHDRLAYMCSEGLWWRCHRSLISDRLKEQGWQVMHIMPDGKLKEHPYTTGYRQQALFR